MRRAPLRSLAALVVALASLVPSGVSARDWVSLGPDGGSVVALASDPTDADTLYAGMREALVFRSDDAGATWSPARAGLARGDVLTLIVDPTVPSTLYAGMLASFDDAPVWKSTDRGAHWQPASTGIAGHESRVTRLPDGTLVATGAGDYPAQRPGIFRSLDGAATWTQVLEGVVEEHEYGNVDEAFGTIVVDPRTPDTLLVCSNLRGLLRSTDGGTEWTRPEASSGALRGCDRLVAGPLPAGRLYAWVGTRLWSSDDGGVGWTRRTWPLPRRTTSFLATASHLYAGTLSMGGYVSSNDGASWEQLGLATLRANAFIDVADRLYVGTETGLHVSDDGGASTRVSGAGLSGTYVWDVAVHPDLPSRLVASVDGLLWRSTDAGAHWARTGPDDISVESLLVDPLRFDRLYAGVSSLGVYRSTDGGVAWEHVPGLPAGTVIDLAAESRVRPPHWVVAEPIATWPAPSVVYALMVEPTTPAVHRSTDGGSSWTALPALPVGEVAAIAAPPGEPGTLYLVGSAWDGGGIARWTEASGSWEVLAEEHDIRGYSVAAEDAEHIWVGANDGVWVSTDGGDSWERRSNGLPMRQVPAIAADRDRVVAFTTAGVFETTDAGASWHEVGTGLAPPAIESIGANLTLLPGPFGAVVTGTQGGGVARLDACERSELADARFKGRAITSSLGRLVGKALLELPAGTEIDPARDGFALRIETARGALYELVTTDGRWQSRRPGQWRFSRARIRVEQIIKRLRLRRLADRPDTLEVRFAVMGNDIRFTGQDVPVVVRMLVLGADGRAHCGEVTINDVRE